MPGVQLTSTKVRFAAPASNALFNTIRNKSTVKRKRIREIIVTAETAVAAGGPVSVYRATNNEAGATETLHQSLDPGEPASDTASVAGTWTTAPTVGTIPIDGSWMPAVIGGQAAMIWIPGEELVMSISGSGSSLVLKADGAALPALTLKVKCAEG